MRNFFLNDPQVKINGGMIIRVLLTMIIRVLLTMIIRVLLTMIIRVLLTMMVLLHIEKQMYIL
jgi:hypothetical protein